MENPFSNIDYEYENNTYHEGYVSGYYYGKRDAENNLIKFLCNLSNEQILNWIDYNRVFLKWNELKENL